MSGKTIVGLSTMLLLIAGLTGCMRTSRSGRPNDPNTAGIKIIVGVVDTNGDSTIDVIATYILSSGESSEDHLLHAGDSIKDMKYKIRKEFADISGAKVYCDGRAVPSSTTLHFDVKGAHNAEFEMTPSATRVRWKYKDDATPLTDLAAPEHGDVQIPAEFARFKRVHFTDGSEERTCQFVWISPHRSH